MATTHHSNITIHRGDPNSASSELYLQALTDSLEPLPDFAHLKGPKMGGPDSPRPHILPPGSVFLYAEEDTCPASDTSSPPHNIGSLCLMPLHAGTPMFHGLPSYVPKAAEIKRMIVFPEARGKGVASALIAEAERIAREEMGVSYMVVETLWLLKPAQSMYRAVGFREREVWGGYVESDSVCFEKWL